MLWQGNMLHAKEDFADAMSALKNEQEAAEFKAIFANAFTQHTLKLLGYLIGDCDRDDRDRVEKLLGVSYPYKGINAPSRFVLGFTLNQTDPEFANLIMQIPRRGTSAR